MSTISSSGSNVRQRKATEMSGSQTTTTNSQTVRKLSFYHELDEWQQDNHFILSGYVKETSSYKECFESLFYVHNETVNIYSHLLPASSVFWTILYYINFQLEIYPNYLGVWEKLNFLQFGAACTFCLFMSSTFHCLKSHSHKISKFGNQLDYFGIVILITCSLISIIEFGFYDHPYYRDFFVTLFLVLGSICTILTLAPKFSSAQYRPLRSLMFVLFGLSGTFPIISAIQLFGYKAAAERCNINYLIWEGVFYISGAVLYAMRVPERFTHIEQDETSLLENAAVGKFDIVGHSHQIFHVFVVIAAYCHWLALVGCYHYLHKEILPSM
ncbi:putative hemolysis-ralated integral membrane protein [Scheffersomyces coipomensis]|uniref:putative hemolysis-ralated integral membrane protein n=1 Tax=Scheffersomyces coipomensis TaxID=1788519 RepID=UPI00315D5295